MTQASPRSSGVPRLHDLPTGCLEQAMNDGGSDAAASESQFHKIVEYPLVRGCRSHTRLENLPEGRQFRGEGRVLKVTSQERTDRPAVPPAEVRALAECCRRDNASRDQSGSHGAVDALAGQRGDQAISVASKKDTAI